MRASLSWSPRRRMKPPSSPPCGSRRTVSKLSISPSCWRRELYSRTSLNPSIACRSRPRTGAPKPIKSPKSVMSHSPCQLPTWLAADAARLYQDLLHVYPHRGLRRQADARKCPTTSLGSLQRCLVCHLVIRATFGDLDRLTVSDPEYPWALLQPARSGARPLRPEPKSWTPHPGAMIRAAACLHDTPRATVRWKLDDTRST